MAARVKKQKIQRIKFSREELYQEYFEEMKCLACVSTLQPYQFAHAINMLLDKNFRLELKEMKDADNKPYQIFKDIDEMRRIDYYIICNRNKTDFLIPELPNSDFLLLMNGMTMHPALADETLQKVQQHKRISYAYDFDPFNLKSKDYLIL